ncbi:MAG TPA: hypothetical protein VLF69_04655 [Candidatus Saccharimonadales bacterium]|nr:hypothetical protein [Candidatus Saccharimonadales bacterium]
MKKSQQGFAGSEILFFLVIVIAIGAVGWLIYRGQSNHHQVTVLPPAAPTTVEAAASNYLIAKVGTDNFKKLYVFDKAKSSYANPKDSTYDFIAYHFAPLKAVTNYDDVIMVQVNRNKLTEVFADAVPDCIKDASLCNFKVTGQQALQIAKSNALNAGDTVITWHNKNDSYAKKKALPFVIVASSCKQNISLFIDYRNGSILGRASGCGNID